MFGGDVCAAVEKHYGDAYVTAHFEVPGEMFKLAMRARERDMGVVGSTKNILDFVVQKVDEAVDRNLSSGERLSFVLGTETGMVTAIVRGGAERLRGRGGAGAETESASWSGEIVFPVSTDAVTNVEQTNGSVTPTLDGLTIVPGPAGGEGAARTAGALRART